MSACSQQTSFSPDSVFAGNCQPASYCWEATLLNESVKAAPSTASTVSLRNRSPLGLNLAAPGYIIPAPSLETTSNPSLLDGLLREINHRQAEFKGRTSPWLKWQIPHDLLDNTDVTQLMYFIGRQFQLSDRRDNFYCVSFALKELDAERLALFKGLGFNAIEFVFEHDDAFNSETLNYCSSLAQGFHFQHFGLQLQAPPPEAAKTLHETFHSGGRQPDTITFRPTASFGVDDSQQFQALFWDLKALGYEVLGNDYFVIPGSPLSSARKDHHLVRNLRGYNCQAVSDVLGLGPGNTSATGQIRMTNPEALDTYFKCEFNQYTIEPVSTATKQMVDQLLCYHQLDLAYFRQHYELETERIRDTLTMTPYLESTPPLYGVQDDILTLTNSGVLHLSALCMALHSQLS
ncbi:hypothetical protein KOI40_16755 [Aestuariicella sp. G3-2]|uniref:hypothetical protein n=1 Tax=Pseudomaricurvus albidus TaxID=2842452 RepID=UPI001C0E83EA|nr:hypothetical protein [Aestuariicella albida]MBU3071478.1 hypothetical protein [Aestuariicella albida]